MCGFEHIISNGSMTEPTRERGRQSVPDGAIEAGISSSYLGLLWVGRAMGYHVIDPDEIEPAPDRPSEMRYISEAAGMEEMGLRLYRVQPGEEIPKSGLHYHEQQEEVFYVVSGELRVETPETEYQVAEGAFFIAESNSAHRAFNHPSTDQPAVVIGMGAPAVSDGHVVDR